MWRSRLRCTLWTAQLWVCGLWIAFFQDLAIKSLSLSLPPSLPPSLSLSLPSLSLLLTFTALEDYNPFNIQETFTSANITSISGNSVICPSYSPLEDDIVEGTQSFFVVMDPISDRVVFAQGVDHIEVYILDNDGDYSSASLCR